MTRRELETVAESAQWQTNADPAGQEAWAKQANQGDQEARAGGLGGAAEQVAGLKIPLTEQ